MRWAGHVACMGVRRGYMVFMGNAREEYHLKDPGVDGR
jgi:hypothetical protein